MEKPLTLSTLTVFIASSSELSEERKYLGNRIRELSDQYEKDGKQIVLNIWEDYPPEYEGRRKQDQYNEDLLDKSQLVFVLFRSRCGNFTQEEINRALKNNRDCVQGYQSPSNNTAEIEEFVSAAGFSLIRVSSVDDVWISIKLKNYR